MRSLVIRGAGALLAATQLVLFGALRRSKRARARAEERGALLALELESIIRYSPVSIALLSGPDFVYEIVNPAYEALAPGEPMAGRTVAEAWPEAAELLMPLLLAARDTQTVYRATGMAVPRRRGRGLAVEERFFDFAYVPLPGPGSDASRKMLVVANEVTGYKRTEAALRNANQELTTIHANIPIALFVVDDRLRALRSSDFAGRTAQASLPYPRGTCPIEMVACLGGLADFRACGSKVSCHECRIRLAALDSLRHGNRHEGIEASVPVSVNGRQENRWVLVSTAPMQLDGKKVLICVQDITARRHTEEALQKTFGELEAALKEKTALLQEVHHRVKNNLAVICGLLSMNAGASELPETKLALEASRQRVYSIALIHEQLYGSNRFDRINFADYVEQLVRDLNAAFAADTRRISIRIDAEPIELGVHRAVPCALILNELLTNAFKHAFPGQRTGKIQISFRESEPGYLELGIEDDGVGSDPGSHAQKSAGSRIIDILTKQLGGSLKQEPSQGAKFVLRFPAGTSRRAPPSGPQAGVRQETIQ